MFVGLCILEARRSASLGAKMNIVSWMYVWINLQIGEQADKRAEDTRTECE